MKPRAVGDRHQVAVKLIFRDLVAEQPSKNVEIDLARTFELAAVDRTQPLKELPLHFQPPLRVVDGFPRQSIIEAMVSHLGRTQRIFAKVEFPGLIQQLRQLGPRIACAGAGSGY
jgi:hypothetical protein